MSDTANKHLFLHRRKGQAITFQIGDVEFAVRIGDISSGKDFVTLNIHAPKEVKILRTELLRGPHG